MIRFPPTRGEHPRSKLIAKLGTITELSEAAELFGQQEQIKYTDDYEILEQAFNQQFNVDRTPSAN